MSSSIFLLLFNNVYNRVEWCIYHLGVISLVESVLAFLCLLFRAYRTPLCKSKRGGFKDTYADDLLAPVLKVFLSLVLNLIQVY